MNGKPVLSLDFDGVVHSYTSGWKGAGNIPDEPVPGAIAFITEAVNHFRVCICSSRCVQDEKDSRSVWVDGYRIVLPQPNYPGIYGMVDWLRNHGLPRDVIKQLEFWVAKPPAHIMIDDRALRFDGNWSKLFPDELVRMQPWNHHERHP